MAAAATDLISRHEVRDALRLGSNDVALEQSLERLVSTVSELFDAAFGPHVIRTVVELYDQPCRGQAIRLRTSPADTITTVTVDTVATTDFVLSPDGEYLRAKSGNGYGSWLAFYAQGISVTYQAGRYATTAAVSARVKDAAILQLKDWWPTTQYGTRDADGYEVAASRSRAGLTSGILAMFPDVNAAGIA